MTRGKGEPAHWIEQVAMAPVLILLLALCFGIYGLKVGVDWIYHRMLRMWAL